MELDDLKTLWAERDRKLDDALCLNQRLLQESVLGRVETALRRLSRQIWFELLPDILAVLLLGSFLGDHWDEPRFAVPALALHLGAIVLIGASIRQLMAISEIDYGAPIVTIQERLGTIRRSRIRTTMATILLSPLAWPLLFIVAMKGLLDVDVYATFDTTWLAANFLFGLLFLAAAVWLSRRYGSRLENTSLARRLLRDIGGQNLALATDILASVQKFAGEENLAS